MKRILAVFLTLAMALNIAPVAAFAATDSDAASIVAVEETDENASSRLDKETAKAIASDPFCSRQTLFRRNKIPPLTLPMCRWKRLTALASCL